LPYFIRQCTDKYSIIRVSDTEEAPQEQPLPEARPTDLEVIVDTTRVHPLDRDDILDTHYSGLERLRPHGCYRGVVFIGYLVEDSEAGEEVEVFESVPYRRCKS